MKEAHKGAVTLLSWLPQMIILKLKIAILVAIFSMIIACLSIYNFANNEKVLEFWVKVKERASSFKFNNLVSSEQNLKSKEKEAENAREQNDNINDGSGTDDNKDTENTVGKKAKSKKSKKNKAEDQKTSAEIPKLPSNED